MDFQTHDRLHGYKIHRIEKTKASTTYRDLYRETCPRVFKSERTMPHDCRPEVAKEFTDNHRWETWMFSHGINQVYRGVEALHSKGEEEGEEYSKNKKPDKILFDVGTEGSGEGDFRYPRGVAVDEMNDILVADSANNRIQRFNQCAVFKTQFGKKGSGDGEFNNPTGVAVLKNGDVAVVDSRNKRVQIFDPSGNFIDKISTKNEPYSIIVKSNDNIILGTISRSVEIYTRNGELKKQWNLGQRNGSTSIIWVAVCNDRNEIVVSDPEDKNVKVFTYGGRLKFEFDPVGGDPSLCVVPGPVTVNENGEIVLADSLNHVINQYSAEGTLLRMLTGPVDDTGSAQALALSPLGHLVVTEYSSNGPHCLKVFRYGDCECHRARPPSRRRRSPTVPKHSQENN